jgi:hypothetical protein
MRNALDSGDSEAIVKPADLTPVIALHALIAGLIPLVPGNTVGRRLPGRGLGDFTDRIGHRADYAGDFFAMIQGNNLMR